MPCNRYAGQSTEVTDSVIRESTGYEVTRIERVWNEYWKYYLSHASSTATYPIRVGFATCLEKEEHPIRLRLHFRVQISFEYETNRSC